MSRHVTVDSADVGHLQMKRACRACGGSGSEVYTAQQIGDGFETGVVVQSDDQVGVPRRSAAQECADLNAAREDLAALCLDGVGAAALLNEFELIALRQSGDDRHR